MIRALETLPDNATILDAIDRLMFIHNIQEGLAQAEAGDLIPHDEVVRQMAQRQGQDGHDDAPPVKP